MFNHLCEYYLRLAENAENNAAIEADVDNWEAYDIYTNDAYDYLEKSQDYHVLMTSKFNLVIYEDMTYTNIVSSLSFESRISRDLFIVENDIHAYSVNN